MAKDANFAKIVSEYAVVYFLNEKIVLNKYDMCERHDERFNVVQIKHSDTLTSITSRFNILLSESIFKIKNET